MEFSDCNQSLGRGHVGSLIFRRLELVRKSEEGEGGGSLRTSSSRLKIRLPCWWNWQESYLLTVPQHGGNEERATEECLVPVRMTSVGQRRRTSSTLVDNGTLIARLRSEFVRANEVGALPLVMPDPKDSCDSVRPYHSLLNSIVVDCYW